ncbi:MAG: DUF4040 family protein [Corynebacterium sp.]|nr:DUF4040 family protein [Corynebacterium sp.]
MILVSVLLLSALAIFASPLLIKLLGRRTGWFFGALYAACFGLLLQPAKAAFDGDVISYEKPWARLGDMSFDFALRGDALSFFFMLLALGVGIFVFTYSGEYFHSTKGLNSFYIFMTGFMFSVLLLVMADNVSVLFIGWELVSLGSFLLIARSGSGGEAGATRTLILTFTGGLLLLFGLGLSVALTGTTSLHEMLASPEWAAHTGQSSAIAIILAFAAFTKAAQLPFHFWLPEAMAAATPVSAFLHAAAVVKAGVYVLLRLSQPFHDLLAWNLVLIWVGIITAVMAGFFAIQKTDLKKLTAYSTVSHLGWIVATIGVGTKTALAAALLHTLAHAMFKSSIFMLIGTVDHQAGSRDVRRLGRLYNRLPWTFAGMVIGCLSMASIPPMLGFMSKEAMLEAFTEAPLATWATGLLLLLAGIGALFTFTYTARIIFGGFVDGPRDMSEVKEAPVALWLPAALPGVLSIGVVAGAHYLNHPLEAAVGTITDTPHLHLSLWHGITIPLIISLLVIVLGVAGVLRRKAIWESLDGHFVLPFNGNGVLLNTVRSLRNWGRFANKMADSFSPTRHLFFIFASVVLFGLICAVELSQGSGLMPRISGIDRWYDLIPLAIIVASVIGLVRTTDRLRAVALLSTTGVGVTLMILGLGAPDVALTQFMVELLTAVILMMVLRHQPRHFLPSGRRVTPAAITGVVVAAVTFFGVWALIGRHEERSPLAMWYIENGPDITGGDNIVNTILVEFRGFDTMGELTVLGMAGVAIAAVVGSIPRQKLNEHNLPLHDAQLNSMVLRQVAKVLMPILGFLALLIFWRGHNTPGGGFIAALVAAGAIVIYYLAKGEDARVGSPNLPYYLTGIGVLIAIADGIWGFVSHGSFLYALHGHALGQHWTSAMIFDAGVFLSVLGMITTALNTLGGRERAGKEN